MRCRTPNLISERYRDLNGVLGGSFDPIHSAHVSQALEVQQALGLWRVTLVPAGQCPYKNGHAADAKHRLAMAQLAIQPHHAFLSVDSVEIDREGPSYALDTVKSLGLEEAGGVLIVGADAFATLSSWHKHLELLSIVDIAVVNRPWNSECDPAKAVPEMVWAECEDWLLPEGFRMWVSTEGAHVVLVPTTQSVLSSSEVRKTLATGGKVEAGTLSKEVLDYIQAHHLYGA